MIDCLIEQRLTSPPTQYRLSGRVVLVKRPNQQYQRTEGKKHYESKENPEKANNTKYSNTIRIPPGSSQRTLSAGTYRNLQNY